MKKEDHSKWGQEELLNVLLRSRANFITNRSCRVFRSYQSRWVSLKSDRYWLRILLSSTCGRHIWANWIFDGGRSTPLSTRLRRGDLERRRDRRVLKNVEIFGLTLWRRSYETHHCFFQDHQDQGRSASQSKWLLSLFIKSRVSLTDESAMRIWNAWCSRK